MGGTFDPIHHGHLLVAEAARETFDIDIVLFVPSGDPPHKLPADLTPAETRYCMAELATGDNPRFQVSRIEIDRSGKSYTIDTVRELRQLYQGAEEFYFIVGADAALEMLNWKDAEELLRLCVFIVVTRPGCDRQLLFEHIKLIESRHKGQLRFLEIAPIYVSSTDIRQRAGAGRSIRYLIPPQIETYIKKNKLYHNEDFVLQWSGARAYLKRKMSAKRYAHILGAAREAARLAAIHGADPKKAYTAGLLHDCAKETPNKKRLCVQYGIELDNVMKEKPDLSHGLLAAEIAAREFGVKGKNTLNAIRYHQTGRPEMSLLEKVVFVADLTEETRYPNLRIDFLRELADKDLDAAVYECLRVKIEHTNKTQKSGSLHPSGVKAFEYYKQLVETRRQ
jgi:nicotinate-nucleotide adenylyltransferase